jgi:hypothetical protein
MNGAIGNEKSQQINWSSDLLPAVPRNEQRRLVIRHLSCCGGSPRLSNPRSSLDGLAVRARWWVLEYTPSAGLPQPPGTIETAKGR